MAPGARVTGNLSAELTSFVGRRGELAEVRRLLAGSRLVTLTGVGGVGKTRLALRAAAGLRRAFRENGVWLVRLDQLRDEMLVAQAVAGALGLRDRAGFSPEAALADYLAGSCCWCWITASTWWTPWPSWPTSCCARRPGCGCWPPAANR